MKVSVCITVLNEEKSITKLINSLLKQTKKPDKIIIVDGGSTDKTIELIKHFQKKDGRIIFIVEKCSRSEGRNLAIELSKNEIIAVTDAGCVAKKDWIEKLTNPFKNKQIEVVAGFYEMAAVNPMQKAMSAFLGVLPSQFDGSFLPSTRSVAFRKSVWESVGGFPKALDDTAEDTLFNYRILKEDINISRMKNARVKWRMPENLKEFSKKIYLYAKGDAKSGIWIHPSKGLKSHNVKTLLKLLRYMFGFVLVILAFYIPYLWYFVLTILVIYSYWSFRKVYSLFNEIRVGFWGVILQFITDISAINGFFEVIFYKSMKSMKGK